MSKFIVVWKNNKQNKRIILAPSGIYGVQYFYRGSWHFYAGVMNFEKASQALAYIRGQE